jgi:hypothetical protein
MKKLIILIVLERATSHYLVLSELFFAFFQPVRWGERNGHYLRNHWTDMMTTKEHNTCEYWILDVAYIPWNKLVMQAVRINNLW